jgi:hypothetical protein
MEKKLTGDQFLLNQLMQALGTIKQLLDENADLKEQVDSKLNAADHGAPFRVLPQDQPLEGKR